MTWVDIHDVTIVEPDKAVGFGEFVKELVWGSIIEEATNLSFDGVVDDGVEALESEETFKEFFEFDVLGELERA